jgi:hypothetical protein
MPDLRQVVKQKKGGAGCGSAATLPHKDNMAILPGCCPGWSTTVKYDVNMSLVPTASLLVAEVDLCKPNRPTRYSCVAPLHHALWLQPSPAFLGMQNPFIRPQPHYYTHHDNTVRCVLEPLITHHRSRLATIQRCTMDEYRQPHPCRPVRF